MEIERKFLVKEKPDLSKLPFVFMSQYYLAIDDHSECRVRRIEVNKKPLYFITVKKGKGLEREELETEISNKLFFKMAEVAIANIEKDRYTVPYNSYQIALDVYHGKLDGLVTAEIEFNTVGEATMFSPPEWFGTEITYDERYKNKNLATKGLS